MAARRAGSRRRWAFLAAAVVAVLAVGSGVALARAGSSGPGYRLATASSGEVEQDLVSVGTLSAAHRASVSFPVSGTLASVYAKLGAKVEAGDVLATLSTTALSQQVVAAEAALAAAQQTLATDEASQSGATTSSATTSSATTSSAATLSAATLSVESLSASTLGAESVPGITGVLTAAITPAPAATGGSGRNGTGGSPGGTGAGASGGAGGIAGATSAVTAAQQLLARARAALDRDLAAAEDALQFCATELAKQPGSPTASASPSASASPTGSPSSTASPTSTASGSPSPSTSPTGSASSDPPAAGDPVAGCLAAIGRAPGKDRITSDRAAVAAADARLDTAIHALTAAARTAASSTSASTGAGTGRTAGTGQKQQAGRQSAGQQTGRGSATARPASTERLAADHAQIDAAQANLVLARRNLAAAVLTSPIAGTVAAVAMAPGQSVSATSSSSIITVIGPGQEQVSTTVSLADLELVKVGDPATVTVDGLASPLPGRVSAIGLLNTTTGSTTSYPVTVLLAPTAARLFDGSGASVTIQVAKVDKVLTVPSSAVHTLGRLSTVTRVKGGKATSTRVTVGAVGTDRTEVRTGLSAGDQVVLATLGTPLPSSDSTTNRRLTGGFTGGGTFGGGTGRRGG